MGVESCGWRFTLTGRRISDEFRKVKGVHLVTHDEPMTAVPSFGGDFEGENKSNAWQMYCRWCSWQITLPKLKGTDAATIEDRIRRIADHIAKKHQGKRAVRR